MTVAGTIALGRGASYPFKTTGAAEGPRITGRCGASYSLSAVEKGGELGGTRRFGLEWVYPPVSKGPVIARFPEKAIAQFSSRRAQITKTRSRSPRPTRRSAGSYGTGGRWRASASSPTR